MSNKYQLEVLLRPPIEFYTSFAAFVACLLLVFSYDVLLMPFEIALAGMLLIGFYGIKRFREGWFCVSYQKGLRECPPYQAAANQIPVDSAQHFIGKGFLWSEIHTQRLYDLRDSDNKSYSEDSELYQWVDRNRMKWRQYWLMVPMVALLNTPSRLNPFRPRPDIGGQISLHGVGALEEREITMPTLSRKGHTIYLGSTQTGKTRALEINLIQDIARKQQEFFHNVVIIIDPKGDADLLKRAYLEAKRNGRLDSFYVFHLGSPQHSARYNPIGSYSRITEVASRIAGQLPNSGNSAAFKEFAWQFVNIVASALAKLGQTPNYRLIQKYIRNIDPLFIEYAQHYFDQSGLKPSLSSAHRSGKDRYADRDPIIAQLIQYFSENPPDDFTLESLIYAVKMERQYFDKITIQVAPFLEKLLTGDISEIISPDLSNMDDTRPCLDWETVIRQRGVVYVGLDALTDPEVASAVGESMFADLTSLAGRIYKEGIYAGLPECMHEPPPKITIHSDEFSDLVGPRFATLANKAGAAGVELVLYSQTISDIKARLGDDAKAGQIIGNINSIIMHRVKEEKTAELITRVLPKVKVNRLTAVSGVTDAHGTDASIDFVSNNQDRISEELVPMLETNNITSLPIGQSFSITNGNQLHKLRLPLPMSDEEALPDYLGQLMKKMQQSYRSEINLTEYRVMQDASTAIEPTPA